MATPTQIFPTIEGLIGFQLGTASSGATTARGRSTVTSWIKSIREVFEEPDYRYLTDLQFRKLLDVDETGETITDATHLIAALIEMTSTIATDGAGWVAFDDSVSFTFDGTAALPNTVVSVVSVNDVQTTGVAEYYPCQWYAGAADGGAYAATGIFLPNTGLAVAADGNDGGNPAANALNVYVLYRN